ncbi:MAG: tetratricopeptide repeat protein [Pseudomonadota bacterium]
MLGLLLSIFTLGAHGSDQLLLETTVQPAKDDNQIGYIADLALLAGGRLATADSGLGVSSVLDGKALSTTSYSDGDNVFDSARISGIASWPDGRFALANMSDSRIAVFDADSQPLYRIGTQGTKEGAFENPRVIATGPSGRLYVADSGNKRISVYSSDGVFLHAFGQTSDTKNALTNPVVVTVDKLERVYVLEQQPKSKVSVFSHNGELIKRFSNDDLQSLLGGKVGLRAMAVDARGTLYLGDGTAGKIFIVDWEESKLVSVFGSKGSGPGRFDKLSALLALPNYRLAVADSGDKKIEIYKIITEGADLANPPLLSSVAVSSLTPKDCEMAYRVDEERVACLNEDKAPRLVGDASEITFSSVIDEPLAFANTDDGYFLLDDDLTLKGYDANGQELFSVGQRGKQEGEFNDPQDLAFANDRLYVADTGNSRIQIFSRQGVALGAIYQSDDGLTYFDEPVGVASDSRGNIFVADDGTKSIKVFSAEGLKKYEIENAAQKTFNKFFDLAMDADNRLYVLANSGNNAASILIFQDQELIFEFGAAGDTGPELYEPNAMAVSLTPRPWVSVFGKGNQQLNTYHFKQIPAPVTEIEVIGGINESTIDWPPAESATVIAYNVYASKDLNGSYAFLSNVNATESSYVHRHNNEAAPLSYQVSSISGFNVEGLQSEFAIDDFRQYLNAYEAGDFETALPGFERLSVLNPANGAYKQFYGLSLTASGNHSKAASVYEALAEIEGYETDGTNMQISALSADGKSIEASALIFNAIAEGTATFETLLICGRIGLELDDAITTIDCLEQALEKQPNHLETHVLLARAYLSLNIPEQALAEFDIALSIAPDDASIWYEAGLVYQLLDRQVEATQHFEKTLENDPEFTAARLQLVKTYFATGQIEKVNNLAVKLAAEKDTKAYGQYLLGEVAKRKGDETRAIVAFTRSTRLDQTNTDAWIALADLYFGQDNSEKAYSVLATAEKANPDNIDIARRIGVLNFNKAEYEQAVPYLLRAADIEGFEHAQTHKMLAESYSALENTGDAIKHSVISLKSDESQNELRLLLADLYRKQGKNIKAIDYIRDAIEREPGNDNYHVLLGEVYTESNFYDDALTAIDKAMVLAPTSTKAMIALGKLYNKRRMFDQAISTFEQVNNIEPSDFHQSLLDEAYANHKRANEFASNAPRVLLSDLRFEQIFSATYKQYAEKPLGYVKVENLSGTDYGGLKLSMEVKGYMDFPWNGELDLLEANSVQEVPLYASFNNKILEIDEDTGVQVELSLNYVRDGQQDSVSINQPMTIYGKNAILWGESKMVGSFVTPKDTALHEFIRPAINASKIPNQLVNKQLLTAMTLFEVLSAHGIKYIEDPTSPYSMVEADRVDYVQFARETLSLKSGDCDDLSVLFSASLENLGIETALLEIPGHMLFMLNTGLSADQRDQITSDDELLAIYKGSIWIPIEATMIATSFAEAWTVGAQKYRENIANRTLNIVEMRNAWESFQPVTLSPQKNTLALPDQKILSYSISQENSFLLEKAVARLTKPYDVILDSEPRNTRAKMQIAIYFAKYGLDEKAQETFDQLLILDPSNSAVHNNTGNIHFRNGEYDRALTSYARAEELDGNDPNIKINQSMAFYRMGDLDNARKKFDQALAQDAALSERYASLSKLLTQ